MYLILAFQQLSWLPTNETFGNNMDIIEQFVATLYCKDVAELGHTRFEMFLHSATNDFRKLPPSRRSLEQHVKRSSYQAGWVWGNTLSCRNPPSKLEWGWRKHPTKDELTIDWTGPGVTISDQISVEKVIATCKCQVIERKCLNCKCNRSNMPCLRYCHCKRSCVI